MFDAAAHAHRILAILEAGDVMDTTKGYRCEYPGGWFFQHGAISALINEDGPCSNASLYKEDMIELEKDGETMLFCPACAAQLGKHGWQGNPDGIGGEFLDKENLVALFNLLEALENPYDFDDQVAQDPPEMLGVFDIAFTRDEGLDLVDMKPQISKEEQEALDAAEKAKDKKTTPNRTVSAKEAVVLLDASHQNMEPAVVEEFTEPEWKHGNFLELMYSIRMMGTYRLTDMDKRELRLARKRRKSSR